MIPPPTSTSDAPPREPRTEPASGQRDGPSPSTPGGPGAGEDEYRRPRPGGPGVVIVAFTISALLHFLFLILYPILMERVTRSPGAPVAPGARDEPQGTEIVLLLEVEDEESPTVEEPEEPEPEDPVEPVPEVPSGEGETSAEPAEEEGDPRSAAERLRVPERGDPRIWGPIDPALTELTEEEWARIRVYSKLEALRDSTLSEQERLRRAMDWTYTDAEGNRWGVSPGRLHLGKVSIPLPFNFSAPPTAQDLNEAWQWSDTERASQSTLVRDVWKERIEAIRERRDRERADSSGVRR